MQVATAMTIVIIAYDKRSDKKNMKKNGFWKAGTAPAGECLTWNIKKYKDCILNKGICIEHKQVTQ